MGNEINLVGFEIIVESIDNALRLLVDALGLELLDRYEGSDPVGEFAVLNSGGIAITLFEPRSEGAGYVLPAREPRLAQLVFGVEPGGIGAVAVSVTEVGVPAQRLDDSRFFIPPASTEGALGTPTAIVVAAIDDPT